MMGATPLGAVRRRKIIDLVEGRGSVAVSELSEELGVSEATIRRDLRELGASWAVTRTHGGVVDNASAFVDLPNEERMLVRSEEKRRIGRAAIDLLSRDEIVFLDAGTTAPAVARSLWVTRGKAISISRWCAPPGVTSSWRTTKRWQPAGSSEPRHLMRLTV